MIDEIEIPSGLLFDVPNPEPDREQLNFEPFFDAFLSLTPLQRSIFVRREIQGKMFKEIAEEDGEITINGTRLRYVDALRDMRKFLWSYGRIDDIFIR